MDSDAQTGTVALEVTTGSVVSNLIGVLDYSARAYTVLPDPGLPTTVTGQRTAVSLPLPEAGEFTVSTLNLNRFFDSVDEPGNSDSVLTATAFSNRSHKVSLLIRNILRSPDIIAVQEVENLAALQNLAGKINADAAAVQSSLGYEAFLLDGNSLDGLDLGLLVKSARIEVQSVVQVGRAETVLISGEPAPRLLHEHPPLILIARVNESGPSNVPPVTVIATDLRGLPPVGDSVDDPKARAHRLAQAQYVANLAQTLQATNPAGRLVVVGGFNAHEFNDGWLDVLGVLKGSPAVSNQVVLAGPDLVTPDLFNLTEMVPSLSRYSEVAGGSAQMLDHILVNGPMLERVSRVAVAHVNADFPETYRSDLSRPERAGMRDPFVAYFTLRAAARLISLAPGPGGSRTITAQGDVFRPHFIEAKSDLGTTNWTLLGPAATNAAGRFIFTDTDATNFSRRFYRLHAP